MLNHRNAALMRDWIELETSLSGPQIPLLLEPYRIKIVGYCQHYRLDTEVSLALLQMQNDSILEDLLSKTQVATNSLRIISNRLATPVLRASSGDALCLKILTWIHQSHAETSFIPAAFASGDVAILPMMRDMFIYFFPGLEQHGLLFQPLHYHEFGHGLYVLHKPEMDALVKDLQVSIFDMLTPLSQRNDRHAEEAAKKQKAVVNRSFLLKLLQYTENAYRYAGPPIVSPTASQKISWAQSNHLYRVSEDLERSKHPVTWLRIRLLVHRARKMGLSETALRVEREWETLARVMQIDEDYHGFYEDTMEDEVHRAINDMLAEASPREFLQEEIMSEDQVRSDDSSVTLVNQAWRIHNTQPDAYAEWEKNAIKAYLE